MATARKHIAYEDFIANVGAVFDEVAAEGTSLLVERGGQVFEIVPRAKRRQRKSGVLGPHDSMRNIIGMAQTFPPEDTLLSLAGAGSSAEPTDIAKHKDDYIAEAILGERHS